MKGIILSAGEGSRLYPLTKSISKQILPVYDKPMIYYPLSVLMLAGIKEILIITTKNNENEFKNLLQDGKELGINIKYKVQEKPNGIAEAFILGEGFIGTDSVALILGDNLFYGQAFTDKLKECANLLEGARIFAYQTKNVKNYAVVEFETKFETKLNKKIDTSEDNSFKVKSLEEKPENPKSSYAVPGLYFYDNSVIEKAKKLIPSNRGELEINDINKLYLKDGKLKLSLLGRGFTWFDMGTAKHLLQASNYVEALQERQGFYIACLEEIAYNNNWISKEEVEFLSYSYKKTDYSKYLFDLIKGK